MAYTTINKGSSYFNTKLYTGNGSATQAITGVGFQPDFSWVKNRSSGAAFHRLVDVIRGATKTLYSNSTIAESTADSNGYIASFDSDGLTVNLGSSGTGTGTNSSGDNFVTWNWLANGAGVSNTAGSITSTVSANTTSGFSICTLTTNAGGSGSYGHGLGVAPSFIIQKSRTNVTDWYVYHKSLGASAWLELNKSDAATTGNTAVWSGTAPSSTVVNLGSGWVNSNHGNVVAYCFAEVKGYSKFGSYTGNGNADGTFVYTGFKPAFIMYKQSSAAGESWIMQDGARDLFNVTNKRLLANASNAEADEPIDFLSNGFKCRTTGAFQNASGSTYIYMCFASNPFVSSTLIPTTAR
jgi:hypothetical protein